MNYYNIVTADETLKATEEEFLALEAALEGDEDSDHGFEIEFFSDEADPSIHIYATENGTENELPDEFLLLLGKLIARNGLSYLQFGVAFTADRPIPGSHGGTSFRIHTDGIMEYPDIVWQKPDSAAGDEASNVV